MKETIITCSLNVWVYGVLNTCLYGSVLILLQSGLILWEWITSNQDYSTYKVQIFKWMLCKSGIRSDFGHDDEELSLHSTCQVHFLCKSDENNQLSNRISIELCLQWRTTAMKLLWRMTWTLWCWMIWNTWWEDFVKIL